jgi:hypothetical protein
LALTYSKQGDEEKALYYYQQCKTLSGKVKNSKLELDCLVKALQLRETLSVKTGKHTIAPTEKEYLSALEVNLILIQFFF